MNLCVYKYSWQLLCHFDEWSHKWINKINICTHFSKSSPITHLSLLFQVYDKLQSANKPNITIFRKEDLPDSYFLKNHRRTAPIIIRADNGILIHAPWKCSECTVSVAEDPYCSFWIWIIYYMYTQCWSSLFAKMGFSWDRNRLKYKN